MRCIMHGVRKNYVTLFVTLALTLTNISFFPDQILSLSEACAIRIFINFDVLNLT